MRCWSRSPLTYLDSATYGLPPAEARSELLRVADAWACGSYDLVSCDEAIACARAAFARLHRVPAADVAIGHQVSPLVGLVAAALPPGGRVLTVAGEFTSVLFPFLAAGCELRCVGLEELPEAIDARTDLVAFSAVQSADGRVADLPAIAASARAHGVPTLVDSTQASGWLPIDAGSFDVVICAGYKWLCQPRGTAFMAINPAFRERVRPLAANWYAGADPWTSFYGLPLRLADDARRFDVSPAWLSWHPAAISLAAIEAAGLEAINRHDVGLANRLRAGLGLEPSDSAIVSVAIDEAAVARLTAANVKLSQRDGCARVSCHVYNDVGDVDRCLDALCGTQALAA